MVCVFCGTIKTSVRNSRHTNRNNQVWRRRQCERCGRLFTTRERVELGFLQVLKRDGSLEPFSRAKLLRSLILPLDHMRNDAEGALALADTIETLLLKALPESKEVIKTTDIAKTTLTALKRYDTRGYVKYLSYQTDTLDARDLQAQLKKSN